MRELGTGAKLQLIPAIGYPCTNAVEHYNHARYHKSLDNLTPADVYFGRATTILAERQHIKRETLKYRRLQHHLQAA